MSFYPQLHQVYCYVNFWLPVFIYILAIRLIFRNLITTPPSFSFSTLPFVGTPASHFQYTRQCAEAELQCPDQRPHSYYSANARFIFYTASYGQFNNQIVSLINALLMAKHADAILVLPYTRMGKESSWDSKYRNLTQTKFIRAPQLVGHYFNYTQLLASNHVVRPSQFFSSPDGLQLLNFPSITTAYRSGAYFRRLFSFASGNYLNRPSKINVIAKPHDRLPLNHICDLRPSTSLGTVNQQGRNGRFTFLPVIFRRHNLNCSQEEPHWLSVRQSLVPRDEYIRAVDYFLESLPKPVFSIHLRIFLNGDLPNFTPGSVVAMIFRNYGSQLAQCNAIFVAYSLSSRESRKVVQMLRNRFHGTVADGSHSFNYYRPEDSMYATLPLSSVLFDMWVCVKSYFFLGRLGSSLSWNVVYWRQAFWRNSHLEYNILQRPLWYQLSHFTTTGARRQEGSLLGSRFITD